MIWLPPRGSLLLIALTCAVIVATQAPNVARSQEAATDSQESPETSAEAESPAATEDGDPGQGDATVRDATPADDDDGDGSGSGSAAAEESKDAASDAASDADATPPASGADGYPEGYQEEFGKRMAVFADAQRKLTRAISDQRDTYIRYLNREDRDSAARERYLKRRLAVRDALDETYLAALDVLRMGLDQEAATFAVTMIQHRLDWDIYDAPTLEGAARMIDGGSQLAYLFQAAARSAVVSGEFKMAKRVFEALEDDNMEDIDRTLLFHLEEYEAQFEAEKRIREKEEQEDRLPRVALETTQGKVVVELFLDQAPTAVSNFIGLVENGFYDGLDFYQVIDHLIALTGDPAGDGTGTTGKFLMDEHQREDARKAFRGSLVMAKAPLSDTGKFVPNSASCQFAILFLPMLSVSEEQTVFGRVIEGMGVISRLRRIDPSKKKGKGEIVMPPDRIIEATVIRRPEQLPEAEYMDLYTR